MTLIILFLIFTLIVIVYLILDLILNLIINGSIFVLILIIFLILLINVLIILLILLVNILVLFVSVLSDLTILHGHDFLLLLLFPLFLKMVILIESKLRHLLIMSRPRIQNKGQKIPLDLLWVSVFLCILLKATPL